MNIWRDACLFTLLMFALALVTATLLALIILTHM